MSNVAFLFAGHRFEPRPCGALFWPARRALLVADLHLEKGSWYASLGQPLPPYDTDATLDCLQAAMTTLCPAEVWCLGDSFHDRGGAERLAPAQARRLSALVSGTNWTWIGGNHDGLSAGLLGGRVSSEVVVDGITLRHEADTKDLQPEISGHFHPKLRLRVRGRSIARRCYLRSRTKLLLPAYGALTGGLDADDPAIGRAFGHSLTAFVPTEAGVLRFPL